MLATRSGLNLSLLGTGKVLAVGGNDGSASPASCEIYDFASGAWQRAPGMNGPSHRRQEFRRSRSRGLLRDVLGQKPRWIQRLFGKRSARAKQARFARSFDHLIVHCDAEGFYLPQDFDRVIFADDRKLTGQMLGSVPTLLAELDRLAAALGVPEHLHPQSGALWEAVDSHGEGDELWQR